MMSEKEKLISQIKKLIAQIIKDKLSDQQLSNEKEYISSFLKLSPDDLKAIITFVADILPEKLYLDEYENVHKYCQTLIAEELIMFLAQEDISSPYFKNNLTNFREEMLSIISGDIHLDDNNKLYVIR